MTRPPRLSRLLAAGLACATLAACGKKGPPLAPMRILPARVVDLTARRLGGDVYLQFTLPATNQDGRSPADLVEMQVLGLTQERDPRFPIELTPLEFKRLAARVAAVPVKPPPPPEGDAEGDADAQKEREKTAAAAAAPVDPAAPADERPVQGAKVTVMEHLTAAERQAIEPVRLKRARERAARRAARREPADDGGVAVPLLGPPPLTLETRTYVVFGVNHRRQDGPSAALEVPLSDPPSSPSALQVTYSETAVSLLWRAPADARRPAQRPVVPVTPRELRPPNAALHPADIEPAPGPFDVPEPAPLASRPNFTDVTAAAYNVYEVPKEPGSAPLTLPLPVNPTPLETVTYEDARVEFGVERCYVVRTVVTFGEAKIESDASPPACVTLTDVFPPPPPTGLGAVASEGGISLIWEGSASKDLAGYIVLRGEAPGDRLVALMTDPIKETTWRDTTVQSEVRYVYAVVAVDTADPPNVSAQSNRAAETAR